MCLLRHWCSLVWYSECASELAHSVSHLTWLREGSFSPFSASWLTSHTLRLSQEWYTWYEEGCAGWGRTVCCSAGEFPVLLLLRVLLLSSTSSTICGTRTQQHLVLASPDYTAPQAALLLLAWRTFPSLQLSLVSTTTHQQPSGCVSKICCLILLRGGPGRGWRRSFCNTPLWSLLECWLSSFASCTDEELWAQCRSCWQHTCTLHTLRRNMLLYHSACLEGILWRCQFLGMPQWCLWTSVECWLTLVSDSGGSSL